MVPPRNPVVLSGELWGIAAYFNPVRYANRLENAKRFSAEVRRQGLRLLIVELALDDHNFALDGTVADRLVQIKTKSILWQKERLLNIALDHLPQTCDRVVWLDVDILFENHDWVRQTEKLLTEYVVVQPYSIAWWLPAGVREIPKTITADKLVAIKHGLAYTQSQTVQSRETFGHLGFCWAARRAVLQQHKFYDRLIMGFGDFAICWGIYGDRFDHPVMNVVRDLFSPAQLKDLSTWQNTFHADIRGSSFYVEGRVFHLWHGKELHRQHFERLAVLRTHAFDPSCDIALDSNGCWRWSTEKRALHDIFR